MPILTREGAFDALSACAAIQTDPEYPTSAHGRTRRIGCRLCNTFLYVRCEIPSVDEVPYSVTSVAFAHRELTLDNDMLRAYAAHIPHCALQPANPALLRESLNIYLYFTQGVLEPPESAAYSMGIDYAREATNRNSTRFESAYLGSPAIRAGDTYFANGAARNVYGAFTAPELLARYNEMLQRITDKAPGTPKEPTPIVPRVAFLYVGEDLG